MTQKEFTHALNKRKALRRAKQKKKQPFPKVYSCSAENYELFEAEESQKDAVMVHLENSGIITR